MKAKIKNNKIISFIFSIVLLIACFSGVVFSVAGAFTLNIDDSVYFTYVDVIDENTSYKYKCYRVSATEKRENQETHSMEDYEVFACAAISWFFEDGNDFPEGTLTIPNQVNDGKGHTYDVKIIYKEGFKGCTSSAIELPTSIISIKEEAFAYCENITSFTLPHEVDEICASAFMDCRSLQAFYYSDSNGNPTLGNDSITTIGDHAFDSCVSLKGFYCPSTLTHFGQSCFQNCQQLGTFFFPNSNSGNTNKITVEKYAFADCGNLQRIYMDTNVIKIEDYAFSGCNAQCKISYTGGGGDSADPYGKEGFSFEQNWRKGRINNSNNFNIPIEESNKMVSLTNYPGLFFTVVDDKILLDWGKTKGANITLENKTKYIRIDKFLAPYANQAGYWTYDTGTLIIPNELYDEASNTSYKVKVIGERAFENQTDVKVIHFNADLIQICNRAFYHANNIQVLDFSGSTKLKELSYELFNSKKVGTEDDTYNEVLTNLNFPTSLTYIADYAFYNFTNLTGSLTFPEDSKLDLIGEYAFAICDSYVPDEGAGTIDLVLPKSLQDPDKNKRYKLYHPSRNAEYKNGGSVMTAAFKNAWTLRSVTMQKITAAEASNKPNHISSLASFCFSGCKNLVSFMCNRDLGFVGYSCFLNCEKLCQVFLSAKGNNQYDDYDYPWGINEGNGHKQNSYTCGIFTTNDKNSYKKNNPNLVVYVSNAQAPRSNDTSPYVDKMSWNSEYGESFVNEFRFNGGSDYYNRYTRSCIPTYYNIDFLDDDPKDLVYWKLETNNMYHLSRLSVTDFEAEHGLLALVRTHEDNSEPVNHANDEYTVAKYYLKSEGTITSNKVDLSTIPSTVKGKVLDENDELVDGDVSVSIKLTTIGNSAFGATKDTAYNKNLGKYFVLPITITEIEEKAFYRQSYNENSVEEGANYGVRVVTYKSNNNVAFPTGKLSTYTSFDDVVAADSNTLGYCSLPTNLASLGVDAFYNNRFTHIQLNDDLNFIGAGAFTVYTSGQSATSGISFVSGSSNGFQIGADGGLYYVNGSNKILVQMPGGISGPLVLDAYNSETGQIGVTGIGMFACANTKYTSIKLPNTLTHIYGNAFRNNTALTSVTWDDNSSVKYISALPVGQDEDIIDGALAHVGNRDYTNYNQVDDRSAIVNNRVGAFDGCSELTTFDFTKMTNLVSIGSCSFNKCSKLKYMVGSKTYQFYKKTEDSPMNTNKQGNFVTDGILDLSYCTSLRHIDYYAFDNCSSIKYIILPNTTGNSNSAESSLEVGFFNNKHNATSYKGRISKNSNTIIMCGERVKQADRSLSQYCSSADHYAENWFGTGNTSNTLYYYATCKDDIYNVTNATQKYWTKTGNKYFFFDNWSDAYNYFPS